MIATEFLVDVLRSIAETDTVVGASVHASVAIGVQGAAAGTEVDGSGDDDAVICRICGPLGDGRIIVRLKERAVLVSAA